MLICVYNKTSIVIVEKRRKQKFVLFRKKFMKAPGHLFFVPFFGFRGFINGVDLVCNETSIVVVEKRY